MKRIRRVNFFGGPGVGKSTQAYLLAGALKKQHFNIELIDEAIKPLAWQKIRLEGFDPVWNFGNQLHMEEIVLRAGGDIISGGPLIQQAFYALIHKDVYAKALLDIAHEFERKYPSLPIFLRRCVPFSPHGRYQSSEAAAAKLDGEIQNCLLSLGAVPAICEPDNFDRILELAVEALKE